MAKLVNLRQVFDKRRGPWEPRLLLYLAGAGVIAVVAVFAAYHLDVATESSEFCGLLCHSNTPQYITNEVSAHANVECGYCHVGPGVMPKVMAKMYGTIELYMQLTNTFSRPLELPVERMPSVEKACMHCHSSEDSHEDRVYLAHSYASDEANSETITALMLRVGEGDIAGENLSGIHWHASNPVWYVADDAEGQDILWVGVTGDEGELIEYRAVDDHLTEGELASLPRQEMDCMTCHNRSGHPFRKPADLVDEALADGDIDDELPYVKREAVRLLSASYPSQDAGLEAMGDLAGFYRSQYAQVYVDKRQSVDRAVETLQEILYQTVFPEMNLTWDVYPDNLGHTDFPGCFRCHDGEHANEQGEAIPFNCTLCHSVPIIIQTGEGAGLPMISSSSILADEKPDSHLVESFISDHRILASESCVDCHGTIQFGTDNSSFCANQVCHGQEVLRVDLDADFTHPIQLEGNHAQATCNECHQGVLRPDISDCASCHQPDAEPHFGIECTDCHTPDGWVESAASWVALAPSNPHGVEAVDCLLCHGAGGPSSVPATHKGLSSESCLRCHETGSIAQVPTVAHVVEGVGDCLACHSEGVLKPTSVTHQGISPGLCLYCHKSGPVEQVPPIPHIAEEGSLCLTCHDEDKLAPIPLGHRGWPDVSCLLCHESVPAVGVPTIPHAVEQGSRCLACHDEGRLEPVPASHTGRSDESCLLCHEIGSSE